MRKTLLAIITFITFMQSSNAQVFKVDTLKYSGNVDEYINLVIMGDGYTASQQDTFISDAGKLSTYLLNQSPWSNYKGYFNVFAIRVISAESGTKHPNNASDCGSGIPVSNPNTYLGCTFDAYGIHRLVVPNDASVATVLANNFPKYDQVFVIANSPYYGGSGGTFATSTVDPSSNEVTAHEIGHSFAALADEYYAGDGYAAEKVNMTKQTNPGLVKWKSWYGFNGTGIYQHCCGGQSSSWYKPHMSCKMNVLNSPFCSVCSEAIVESIHKLVDPLVTYLPLASTINSTDKLLDFKLTELMKPSPNTLRITWKLDGKIIARDSDSIKLNQDSLSTGPHVLVASVTDTGSLIRVDNHANIHVSTVSWTINKAPGTGIKVSTTQNRISCSMYPNPAGDMLHVNAELEHKDKVSLTLMSADGKIIMELHAPEADGKLYSATVDLGGLERGVYFICFTVGDFVQTEKVVKQ